MGAELTGEGISLGIVTIDHDAMMGFYGETLALPHARTLASNLGTTEFFAVGDSMLKLIRPKSQPASTSPGGGVADAGGIRYITLRVTNLEDILKACDAASAAVVLPKTEFPGGGGWIAMVRDPDGNPVEFVQQDAKPAHG
jgi:predicted enzyme related to lactoylglutathione lyase